MAERVGHQLGNYRLLRELGQGGFARVYLAEHIHLKTQAAVKILNANLAAKDLERFLTEAQIVSRLRHPHIIRVLEFGVEDSSPFLVMDYAPRGTLRARYPHGIPLPLAAVLPHVQQVAAALQFAHERKLVHRDVKPENMLLDARDAVLLSDFGTATIAHSSQSYQREAVAGTVSYMAPEQLQGQPRPASDQYALGVVVYEWLAGERPFQGSFAEIASQQLFAPPPSLRARLPALAPAVEEVILTALAKDHRERFASVQDFAAALEHASQAAPSSFYSAPAPSRPTSQAQISQGNEITLLESFQLVPEEALSPKRYRPHRARSRGKAALRVASILLLVVGLAVMVLLMARLSPSAPLVNASVTVTPATPPPPTPTATTRPTKTTDPNAPYAATIPGPCDAASGAHWTAVGTYRCLANALLVTRRQGNNDAGVYFSGGPSSGTAMPLNYDFQVNVSHLQGTICVMISSAFSFATAPGTPTGTPNGASQVGALEVNLCADQTLLVYRIPPPNTNSPLSPLYAAAIAPAASYTIAVSCAMPSCAISVNNRRIVSAPYDTITQMSNIGFTILGNDSTKVAGGSAEFDHFLFTPAL